MSQECFIVCVLNTVLKWIVMPSASAFSSVLHGSMLAYKL